MHRSSGNNEVCTPYLETALAQSPETYRRLDLVAFGFPCQDISNANPKGKGLEGRKSSIFFECMRIVQVLQSSWIIIENVPRLLSINNGKDFGIVLQKMAESGYGYSWNIFDSQEFGVPQQRKRLFIVGCFGAVPPPQILFQPESNQGDVQTNARPSPKSKCINARTGFRQDSSSETFIAKTVGCGGRGYNGWMWQENYLAELDTARERTSSGISRGLDSARGTVIGNAVTVPVIKK